MEEKRSLKQIRFERELSQLQVMLRSGVSMSRISQIENSHYIPNEREKQALATSLDLVPGEIDWPRLAEGDAA